jgi:simple sugar transport system ATP-binding protein
VKLNSVQDALRYRIGYVPEDRLNEGLFLTQSVGNNIVVSIIDALVGKAGLLDHQAMAVRVSEWINRVQIKTDSTDRPVGSLSGGNQQRVVLAKWLAGNPRILILNSPTVGVDVRSKAELHDILCDLAKRGTALLVISDDLPELIQVCHRILVMKRGRIMEEVECDKTDETRLNTMLVSV